MNDQKRSKAINNDHSILVGYFGKILSTMDQVFAILGSLTPENAQDSFGQLVSTDLFKHSPTNVCAHYISFFREQDNQEPIIAFFNFLLDGPDSYYIPSMELVIFWVRQVTPSNIESVIKALEDASPKLKEIYQKEDKSVQTMLHLAFVQLIDKTSTYILPDPAASLAPGQTLTSTELTESLAVLSRSQRAASVRGRALICASRIFPFDPAASKNKRPISKSVIDVSPLATAIQSACQGTMDNPLLLNALSNYLKEVKPPAYMSNSFGSSGKATKKSDMISGTAHSSKRPQNARPLPSVLSCLNLISTHDKIDPSVFLQIALIGLIHSSDPKYNFAGHVKHFANDLCNVDGELLVNLVEEGRKREQEGAYEDPTIASVLVSSKTDQNDQPKGDPTQNPADSANDGEMEFHPLFDPFEVPEDEPICFPAQDQETPEMIEQQIIGFAGEDKKMWFQGSELQTWRASRLAMGHFLDQLSSDSFDFKEE